MKALTLHQPWATLIAIGAKTIETRSWPTNYRGPLAIHAAKAFPEYARERFFDWQIREPLYDFGYKKLADMPLGCMVCFCTLTDVVRIAKGVETPQGAEWYFGDYSLGRYMWKLTNVHSFSEPIPARGAQGLWTWEDSKR